MFKRLKRFTFYLLTLTVLLVGLILSLTSILLDFSPKFKQKLIGDLRASVNWIGHVDDIQLDTYFGHPQVKLSNLTIERLKGIKFQAKHAEINIALWRSLLARNLIVDQIAISEGKVQIDQHGYKQFFLDREEEESSIKQIDWNNITFVLRKIQIEQDVNRNFPREAMIHTLTLKSQQVKKLQLSLQTPLNEFSLNSEFKGDLLNIKTWSGFSYIDVDKFQTKTFRDIFPKQPLPELISGRYWFEFDRGGFTGFTANVFVPKWKHEAGILTSIRGTIDLDKQEKRWFLKVKDLSYRFNGQLMPEQQLQIDFDEFFALQSIKAANVDWEPIKPALKQVKLDTKLKIIQGVHIGSLTLAKDSEGHWSLKTNFDGLHIKDTMVEVKNLSGAVVYEAGWLKGEVDSKQVAVSSKVGQYILLDKLTGYVSGQLENKLSLHFQEIEAKSSSATLKGDLKYSDDGQVIAEMDLNTDKIQELMTLIEPLKMPTDLRKWLMQAFPGKGKASIKTLYRGKPQAFDLGDPRQLLSVDAKLQSVDFVYNQHWPQATGLDASLSLRNAKLGVTVKKARLQGEVLKGVHIAIPKIAPKQTVIKVQADNPIDLNNLRQYILHSPLKDHLRLISGMHLGGKGHLTLDLQIPLNDHSTQVKGKIALQDSHLELPKWNVVFDHVTTAIDFDREGFSADSIKGTFLGKPVIGSIERSKEASTIKMVGRIPYMGFLSYLHLDKLEPDAKGELDVHAALKLPTARTSGSVLSIKLVPMRLKTKIKLPMMSDLVPEQIVVYFDNDAVRQVNIEQSGEQLNWHLDTKVPHLKASLKSLDLDALLGVLSGDLRPKEQTEYRISLKAEKIHFMNQTFKKVTLNYQQIKGQTEFDFNTSDGSGVYKTEQDGASLKLSRFDIRSDDKTTHIEHVMRDKNKTIRLEIESLSLEGRPLGKLKVVAKPSKDGFLIQSGKLVHPEFTLKLNGQWHRHNTSVKGTLHATNLRTLLRFFEQEEVIQTNSLQAKFQLSWPGAPWEIEEDHLTGQVGLEITKGTIPNLDKDVERKLGVVKLFNLLSFSSIARKLSLDFSDLINKGLNFDSIKASLAFNPGVLKVESLDLEGDVLYAKLTGFLYLRKKTFDINLQVTPFVTSSLPFIATVAGGPLAGAAAWVANKAVSHMIKNKPFYRYKITGPWDEPVVQKLTLANTSKLRRL